jgi:hypothetical protein
VPSSFSSRPGAFVSVSRNPVRNRRARLTYASGLLGAGCGPFHTFGAAGSEK